MNLLRLVRPPLPRLRRGAVVPDRSARRRARAAVGWGTAAVVTAVAGLAVAVETNRPQWRDPEFGHRLRQLRELDGWRRQAAPDRPLVVMVGSSRAAMGFSPADMRFDAAGPRAPVVYNFAHTGYGPAGALVSARRLLDRGLVPDRLLVEVVPPFLSSDEVPAPTSPPDGSLSLRETRHLAPHQERPGQALWGWAVARGRSWYLLRHSLMSHAGLGDWLPPRLRQDHLWDGLGRLGWMPCDPGDYPPDRRTAATARAAADYAPYLAGYRIAPAQDRLLRDLLTATAAAGAKVALVWMPESPVFRRWYPPGGRELARGYLAGLSREFAVPLFDASEWVDDEAAFLDGHHLLAPAAGRFSRRFARDCLGPWVGVLPPAED